MALTQAQLLCRTPEECGTFTEGVNCGAEGGSLTIADDATLCLGFQPSNGSAADGGKALFRVTVDSFSLLRVDTCTPPHSNTALNPHLPTHYSHASLLRTVQCARSWAQPGVR